MKFDMSVSDNYASFVDDETGVAVLVDSFDNKEFEVRIGTLFESEPAGNITAESDSELNEELEKMFARYMEDK